MAEPGSIVSRRSDDLPDIVFLPGFMGVNMDDSVSGRRIWLSTLPIAIGDLASSIALDPTGARDARPEVSLRPADPIGFIYERGIRAFGDAGIRVHIFPLDFRRSVLDTMVALRAFVDQVAAARPGRGLVFVGHSMGAILAALYPHYDPEWEARIQAAVFLGGTLAGTFEPIEGITGTHWFLDVVGAFEERREREIQQAMSTWPGVYSMLPDPEHFPGAEAVYDARAWPEHARPPQWRLDEIRDQMRPLLKTSPLCNVPTIQLMSLGCPTVETLAWNGGELRAGPMIASGDGTVAGRVATIGVTHAFEVDFPHTFMPNDVKAIRAVIDVVEGRWPDLPAIDAVEAAGRRLVEAPPPVSMARRIVESVARRFVSGDFSVDDFTWPFAM